MSMTYFFKLNHQYVNRSQLDFPYPLKYDLCYTFSLYGICKIIRVVFKL